jgi:enoyl-[acyl-carrier-protein] reductase (NADH)
MWQNLVVHPPLATAKIAAMVTFLLSDRSADTTGKWNFVDGGCTRPDRARTPDP